MPRVARGIFLFAFSGHVGRTPRPPSLFNILRYQFRTRFQILPRRVRRVESPERCPENPMETFFQDIKFGLRSMLKSPTFCIICVLSLALGIGANTTIFGRERHPA